MCSGDDEARYRDGFAVAAYAASIAPQFLGGLLLSGTADRWPRRGGMVACDLARVPLAALMALSGRSPPCVGQ